MSQHINILEELKKISNSIRGRLVMKRHYREAVSSYQNLGLDFKRNQQPVFEAFSFLRVGEIMSSRLKESLDGCFFILSAGRVYSRYLKDNQMFYFNTTVESFLQEVVKCFTETIKILQKNGKFIKVYSLYFELGRILKDLNKHKDAVRFFSASYEVAAKKTEHIFSQIKSLKEIVLCRLMGNEFRFAREDLLRLIQILERVYIPFSKIESAHLGVLLIDLIERDFSSAKRRILAMKDVLSSGSEEQQILYICVEELLSICSKKDEDKVIHGELEIFLGEEIRMFIEKEEYLLLLLPSILKSFEGGWGG